MNIRLIIIKRVFSKINLVVVFFFYLSYDDDFQSLRSNQKEVNFLQNFLAIRKTTGNGGELVGCWNYKMNSFNKYDYFIVDSFEELATMTTEKLRMKRNLEIAYYTGAYGAIDQFKRDAAGLYAILDENPYDINEEPELHVAFEEGVEDAGGTIF